MDRLPTEPGEEFGEEVRYDLVPGDEAADLPSPKQDLRDMATCAEGYLVLVRCRKCNRIAVEGYVCIHCGYSG